MERANIELDGRFHQLIWDMIVRDLEKHKGILKVYFAYLIKLLKQRG